MEETRHLVAETSNAWRRPLLKRTNQQGTSEAPAGLKLVYKGSLSNWAWHCCSGDQQRAEETQYIVAETSNAWRRPLLKRTNHQGTLCLRAETSNISIHKENEASQADAPLMGTFKAKPLRQAAKRFSFQNFSWRRCSGEIGRSLTPLYTTRCRDALSIGHRTRVCLCLWCRHRC